MAEHSPASFAAPDGAEQRPFEWLDYGRFVEVHAVRSGWLVLWGRYEDAGRRKVLVGNRTYRSLDGARRRLADAALELTRRPQLAREALALFDQFPFPAHQPRDLPDPL